MIKKLYNKIIEKVLKTTQKIIQKGVIKMKYVKIENFYCKECGSEEYCVIDLDIIEIVCNNCGEEFNLVYDIVGDKK